MINLQVTKQIQTLSNKVYELILDDILYYITKQAGVPISDFSDYNFESMKSDLYDYLISYGSEVYEYDYGKKEIYNMIDTAFKICDLLSDCMYGEYLLLNDNPTILDLEKDFTYDSYDTYNELLALYTKDFEEEYNTELFFEGRSGKNICVELTADNLQQYYDMCVTQRQYEKAIVDEMNIEW